MAWARPPRCTNGDLDRAGKALGAGAFTSEHVNLVNQWRAAHSFPLNSFQVGLRKKASSLTSEYLVAQRLKRFRTIQAKLARFEKMPLTTIQDIGGCRAVVPTIAIVDALAQMYLDDGCRMPHDYIRAPKDDGYRGIHLVGRYQAKFEAQECWNGKRIEIQLRTPLQHAFATAMETVATFTASPLKFGGGDERWRRFFALMGSAFALLEGTPPVAGVHGSDSLIAAELRELSEELDVFRKLMTWRTITVEMSTKVQPRVKVFVLALEPSVQKLHIYQYTDRVLADFDLRAIEEEIRVSGRLVDAVLVEVRSLAELRRAFPNYYSDTSAFIGTAARIVGVTVAGPASS